MKVKDRSHCAELPGHPPTQGVREKWRIALVRALAPMQDLQSSKKNKTPPNLESFHVDAKANKGASERCIDEAYDAICALGKGHLHKVA
jgi:hypothetical protein